MSSDTSAKKKLLRALSARVNHPTDDKGYTQTPAENLVDGVSMDLFEDDLRNGSGDELRTKFCAAHSSAALAVNSFAWFKAPGNLKKLSLFNENGATSLTLEKQFPIFSRGTPPNLDVWIEREHENVAIESKLTEYLTKKQPRFSKAYDRLAPPELAEPCWWQVYQQAKSTKPQYLDIAQLLKHYFGLCKFQLANETQKPLRLLYLFWEPLEWEAIPACVAHRQQLTQLSENVAASTITFNWLTYSQLWHQWSEHKGLALHAENLKARYEVSM